MDYKTSNERSEIRGDECFEEWQLKDHSLQDDVAGIEIDNVKITQSPQVNVKLKKTIVTSTFDTGCTGSIITLRNCELAGLHVYPSSHSAIQADGNSSLSVIGEIHTSVEFENGITLPLDAVVVTKLKA